MKISYEACRKSITIMELFVSAILKVYKKSDYQSSINKSDKKDLDLFNSPNSDSFDEKELVKKETNNDYFNSFKD